MLVLGSLEDVENKDLDIEKDKKLEFNNDEGVGIVDLEEVFFVWEEISVLIVEEKCILEFKVDF